jgi:hypothetical protein
MTAPAESRTPPANRSEHVGLVAALGLSFAATLAFALIVRGAIGGRYESTGVERSQRIVEPCCWRYEHVQVHVDGRAGHGIVTEGKCATDRVRDTPRGECIDQDPGDFGRRSLIRHVAPQPSVEAAPSWMAAPGRYAPDDP